MLNWNYALNVCILLTQAQFRTSFVAAEDKEEAVYTNPEVEAANHPMPVLPPLYQVSTGPGRPLEHPTHRALC